MKYLFILFFPFLLFSQITPPVILWEHTYTETGLGVGTSLFKNTNNEFLLLYNTFPVCKMFVVIN